jgi:chromosome partitioning protein
MTQRIIFALQKGGVGKTSSTVAVAEIMAASGYKVLVIDFDSQGNATKMLTRESIYKYSGRTIMEAIRERNAAPYIIQVKEGLDLIPAEDKLALFPQHIYTNEIKTPYAVLKRIMAPIENRYDFVFVDVGPSLGDHMINAIVYADHIFIPLDTGDFAMDAMVRFIKFANDAREKRFTKAEIGGIFLTMRDGRSTKYEREISEGIREAYGNLIFKTEIHRRVKIKEMSSEGVDVVAAAMEDYLDLTEEILQRIRKEKTP